MTDRLRPGQLTALLVLSAAALLLPGQGSLSGVCIGAAGLAVCLLPAFGGRGLFHRVPAFLRLAGAAVLALYFLLEAALSAAGLGLFAAHTEQAPTTLPLLTVLLVLAAFYGAALGLESHARAAGLWVGAGAVLLALTTGLLIRQVVPAQLQLDGPAWQEGLELICSFGGELLLVWLFRRNAPGLGLRHGGYFLLSVLGLALLCTGLSVGILGSWANVRAEPLYTAILSVTPEAAFRPDGFYTVVRIAAHYCRVTIYLLGFFRCLRAFPRKWVFRLGSAAGGILTAVVGILLSARPEGAALLARWVRIPGLALGIGLPLLFSRR